MTKFLEGSLNQWSQSLITTGEFDTIIDELNELIIETPDINSNFFKNDDENKSYFFSNNVYSIDDVKPYYSGDLFFVNNNPNSDHKDLFKIEKAYDNLPNINDNFDFCNMLHENYFNFIFYLDFRIQFISQLNMYHNTFFEFINDSNSPLYNTTFIYNSRFKYDGGTQKLILIDNDESCVITFKLTYVPATAPAGQKIYDIDDNNLTVENENMLPSEKDSLKTMFILNASDVNLDGNTAIFSVPNAKLKKILYDSAYNGNSPFSCSTYINEKYNYLLIKSFILYEICKEYYDTVGTTSGVLEKIEKMIEEFEKVLNNNIISIIKEKKLIEHKNEIKSSRKELSFSSNKKGILNTQKLTNELQKYNTNIEINIENVEKKNEEIKIKQKKLDNLQIISIVVIILFVITLLVLLFVNILKKYDFFNNFTYLYGILIAIFVLTITLYLRNLTSVEEFYSPSSQDQDTIKTNYADKILKKLYKIKYIIIEELQTLNFCANIHLDYQDIVSPLIESEEKKYKNLKKNSELKEKITKFNENITNRDVQYNIKMIEFMLKLLLLMIITIILINIYENYIVLIGIISISIFIILLVVYFIEIVRIVRTKSKTYYWNKPIKEKEVIV